MEFKLKHSDLVPESMSSASGNGALLVTRQRMKGGGVGGAVQRTTWKNKARGLGRREQEESSGREI